MLFQMSRNLLWSYLGVPFFILIVLPFLYFELPRFFHEWHEYVSGSHSLPASHASAVWTLGLQWHSPLVYLPTAGLFVLYLRSLRGLLDKFWNEITSEGGIDFRSMDMKGTIEKNVGQLVREVVDRRRNPYGQSAPPAIPPSG